MNRSSLRTWPLLSVVAVLLTTLGCGDSTPKSPDQAVLRVANALAESKPVALWEALPASYQKDVHEIVHGYVGKVDPELWNLSFETAKKAVKVLREKKKFVLGNKAVEQLDKAELEKQYDQLVGILETVVNSEISTHDKAKAVDMGAFLDRTGSKIMADVKQALKLIPEGEAKQAEKKWEQLKKVTAVIKEDKGETALVELTMPDEKPVVMEFVRVEGKWLPKEMVDSWKKMMDEAREGMKALTPEMMKEAKAKALPVFDALNGLLGRLEKANTQEEFDEHLGGFMQMLGGGGKGG